MRMPLKHPGIIISAVVVSAIALAVYLNTRTPADITPLNGDGAETVAWISLVIAVLSLATAVVGLIQKVVELRGTKGD